VNGPKAARQVKRWPVEQEEMMPHTEGGKGNCFTTKHTFQKAYEYVGDDGVSFKSSTDECIHAKRGKSRSNVKTIVFKGERNVVGNVCEQCWGYRKNCCGTRIGQCSEPLDKLMLCQE